MSSLGKHLINIVLILSLVLSAGISYTHLGYSEINTDKFVLSTEITEKIENDRRVKLWGSGYFGLNAPTVGVKSINTFSSLINEKTVETLSSLGCMAETNIIYGDNTTLLTDILLGNKYILSEFEYDKSYAKLIAKTDKHYLYENIRYHNQLL